MSDDEATGEDMETDQSAEVEAVDVDLRQTPEYRRARGSIFMVAFLFYGLLAFMCLVVAIIVVTLLTGS